MADKGPYGKVPGVQRNIKTSPSELIRGGKMKEGTPELCREGTSPKGNSELNRGAGMPPANSELCRPGVMPATMPELDRGGGSLGSLVDRSAANMAARANNYDQATGGSTDSDYTPGHKKMAGMP